MGNKKRILRTIAALTMAAALGGSVFALTGCGKNDAGGPDGANVYTAADQTEERPSAPAAQASASDVSAKVPEYTGPATGPVAGAQQYNVSLKATDLPTGALSENWTNGIMTVASGAEVRSRTPKDDAGSNVNTYSYSIKNGKITVVLPAQGTLKFVFSSGSSQLGSAAYKLTKPGDSGTVTTIQKGDKVLNELTLTNAAAGTYVFEKSAGTVDIWEVTAEYSAEATAIKEIQITDEGVTDYLLTQQLDCTGLKIVAVDEGNVTHDVDLQHCEFDTSNYNSAASGEYQITVTYHLDSNLSSSTKDFTKTYTVKVYAVDSIKLTTIGLASSKQVTVQQAFLPGGAFDKNNLSVIATCKLGSASIEQKLKADWYTVTAPDLTAEGVKTVDVSVDTAYTVGGKEAKASYEVAVKAKKDVAENKVEVTVGETGDFKTLTQAVQYLKACGYASDVVKVIKIQPGTYTEKVWIDVDNVTLIGTGENADDTKITYSLVEGDNDALSNSVWALNCATVHVTGKNFKTYHLAIRNDFDYIHNSGKYSGSQAAQGVALTLDTDGSVIYDTHLYGNQDTLYMKSGRAYYYKSQIDGNIDFIFGGEKSIAFFEDCKIVAIDREGTVKSDPQNGYVTAPQHKEGTKPKYGYVFYNCELTDDGNVTAGAMSLGRPWGAKATVSYINCKFSAAYSQLGTDSGKKISRWNNWDNTTTAAGADYSEFGSTDLAGNPIMSSAVAGGKVLTSAEDYTKDNAFGASNSSAYTSAWDWQKAFADLQAIAGTGGSASGGETSGSGSGTDSDGEDNGAAVPPASDGGSGCSNCNSRTLTDGLAAGGTAFLFTGGLFAVTKAVRRKKAAK